LIERKTDEREGWGQILPFDTVMGIKRQDLTPRMDAVHADIASAQIGDGAVRLAVEEEHRQ